MDQKLHKVAIHVGLSKKVYNVYTTVGRIHIYCIGCVGILMTESDPEGILKYSLGSLILMLSLGKCIHKTSVFSGFCRPCEVWLRIIFNCSLQLSIRIKCLALAFVNVIVMAYVTAQNEIVFKTVLVLYMQENGPYSAYSVLSH